MFFARVRRIVATAVFSLVLVGPVVAQRRVTIYRDAWGVPHIYADREADGFYGLGYAIAEDQADFILRTVLIARGEAAAAFGKSEVESDYTSRLWRHAEEAKAGFPRMSLELQQDYVSWARGINQYLLDHPNDAPAWRPTVEPWDAVAISRWLLWLAYQAGDGIQKCRASGAKLSAVADDGQARRRVAASNEWFLAPWRTKDSAAIVLSDPHGGVDGQFVFEFGLHAGSFEAAGYAMGALPLLVHTRNVSWGMTTGAPSVADCYRVALDPGSETRYRFDGKPAAVTQEKTVIKVKDAPPVTRVLEYTRHNGILSPVVARAPGELFAVSTTYMHRAGDFDEEIRRMVLAKNAGEIKEAMRLLGMFPQNVMAGDRFGGSFYLRAGRTPKRPAGIDWRKALDGNTSKTAWTGLHPLDDLVHLENPASGYMQNDNIAPSKMLEDSPLTKARYPDYIYNDDLDRISARGRRTVSVLSRAWAFTVDDAKDLALDEYWIDTELWKQGLRRSLEREVERARSLPAEAKLLADQILHFDGNARAGSTAALGFWFWRAGLVEKGTAAAVLDGGGDGAGPTPTAATAAVDAVIRAAESMTRVQRAVCAKQGGECRAPTLGDVFRIGRGGKSSYPVGGAALAPDDKKLCPTADYWNTICTHTLRAFTALPPDSAGQRFIFVGSRLLRLVIFTDPIQSFTLHNFGQSSHADSPHYDDQAQMSSRRELKPMLFERAELMKHVVSEKTLDVP